MFVRSCTRSVVFAFAFLALALTANAETRPPNVVLILADDLGWSDTGIYAPHELHRTPALEALAARGMRFPNAYAAAPVCAPSRNALLAGQWTARTGMFGGSGERNKVVLTPHLPESAPITQLTLEPISVTRLAPSLYTLPEALRDQGYATGHFGKWHLGHEPYAPSRHGYDVDEPKMYGATPNRKELFDEDGKHVDERCAAAAIEFMRQNRKRPFFVSFCPFSVHSPWEAKPGRVAAAHQRAIGVDSDASPTYAAMVETLDAVVGRVTKAIDRLGLTEETVVIFVSDNGGVVHEKVDGVPVTTNAPFRSGKGTLYEGGIRVPLVISWPGVVPEGTTSDAVAQTIDLYPTILDLIGAKPLKGEILDGVSLAPALAGRSTGRDVLFWYFPYESNAVPDRTGASAALRLGDFKLIREFYANDDGTHSLQLYDLADDPGEMNDLAERLPFAAFAMDAMLDDWLRATGALLPEPNPDYSPEELFEFGP